MPALTELIGTSTDPTVTQNTALNPVVEPLDGPTAVDDVMDRFPEEVYQQGRDTHLYRFLTALGGDSGAGLLKTQSYAARLKYEAEFLNFQVLDAIYGIQFGLARLKTETYPDFDPNSDALTPEDWDAVLLADQSYRQRCLEFFTATRLGTSPLAMAFAAQAGSGSQAEVTENYLWIFDQYSDMQLGLLPYGTTVSTSEFIVFLRSLNEGGNDDSITFETVPGGYSYDFSGADFDDSTRPATLIDQVSVEVDPDPSVSVPVILEQNVIRNTVDVLDRLRPTATLATIRPDNYRYTVVNAESVDSSSDRIQLSRLVTGQQGVPWPAVDPSQNYFIQAGVENEAGYYYGSSRELPVIFLTIENVNAYTDAAEQDALYGSNEFFDASSGISEFENYRSEYVGFFSAYLQGIFPFLQTLSGDTDYTAFNAVAVVNTPLILEGAAVSD